MKKYIISDLHGNGNMYTNIMSYLEKEKSMTGDDITLYINGDLIDRGNESSSMLLDVRQRILDDNSPIRIKYLGGNHELMMYQACKRYAKNTIPSYCDWFLNGGRKTLQGFIDLGMSDKIDNFVKFISSLKIYHKFSETILDKKIVLVHAKCPTVVERKCPVLIKDDNIEVFNLVWTRKEDFFFKTRIGNPNYFTIIGHTPVDNSNGFIYDKKDNYINIDGGNAAYVLGYKEYDHTPLIEIDGDNNRLIILVFNNQNDIINGFYFDGREYIKIDDNILDQKRKYLNNSVKLMKK